MSSLPYISHFSTMLKSVCFIEEEILVEWSDPFVPIVLNPLLLLIVLLVSAGFCCIDPAVAPEPPTAGAAPEGSTARVLVLGAALMLLMGLGASWTEAEPTAEQWNCCWGWDPPEPLLWILLVLLLLLVVLVLLQDQCSRNQQKPIARSIGAGGSGRLGQKERIIPLKSLPL